LYKGELNIGDIIISCAVLEDGSRILVERSLATALGVRGSGAYYKKKKEKKGALLPEYVSTKYLEPFISDGFAVISAFGLFFKAPFSYA
jgi:hypothetical protein